MAVKTREQFAVAHNGLSGGHRGTASLRNCAGKAAGAPAKQIVARRDCLSAFRVSQLLL